MNTREDVDAHVAAIRKAIQDAGYGAECVMYALRAETEPGGTLYDDEHGYMNPALALEFGHLLARCPGQHRAVTGMTRPPIPKPTETVVLTDKGRKELAQRIDGMNYTFHDESGNEIPVVKSERRVYVVGRDMTAKDES